MLIRYLVTAISKALHPAKAVQSQSIFDLGKPAFTSSLAGNLSFGKSTSVPIQIHSWGKGKSLEAINLALNVFGTVKHS